MNERINELAEQAKMFATPMKFHLGGQDYARVRDEKFAELIVRECLIEIQSLLDCNTQVNEFEQGVYNGLDMAKDCIKEHFGVEE